MTLAYIIAGRIVLETFAGRKRHGLSTVVTSAILLSAVAVLGTGLVTWSQSNLSAHQQNLELDFSKKVNRLNEFLILEHVWFGTTPYSVNMTITNLGSVRSEIVEIKFVNSNTKQNLITFTLNNGTIDKSNSISFQPNFDYTQYQALDIVITTGRGSIFTSQVVP